MSTARGNSNRNRPQKHQNRTVFKNDLHDSSHQTKLLNSLQISGVCKRCKDILDWKIKYKKYKPLTAPRKCVGCDQKTVKHAYHMLCRECAKEKKVCAKCCKAPENEEVAVEDSQTETTDIKSMLKGLPERRRRTMLRYINKQEEEHGEISPELISKIQDIVAQMAKPNFDEDSLFGDDFSGSDDNDEEDQH
ncbi:Uncharacterized protein OBRU01_11385 [Operophtera brumata]|uniref:Uncharacterized protein n=1 Tax=Operophtera brumata TaxID=104452 RepID=A0A0L7LC64_OPEBR|nr:Uncharacterized protein OBRU01_11385 [Operophtera brumata]